MKKDITMFFPAYNEEKNLPELISKATQILKECASKYEIIIVVYEGSTDNTISVVKNIIKKNPKVKLVIQPINKKGIGYAKILGFNNSKYSHIFYADSDNQFNIEDFRKFLPYIDKFDIIAGYRLKRHDPLMRIIISKIYNLLMRAIFDVKERDVDCAFRLINKEVIKNVNLKCTTGLATTEILVKARKKGFKIKEIGVRHYNRKYGKAVFATKLFNLPKPKVVANIIKEIIQLYKEVKTIK